jgi:hypothetical protein
MSTQTQEPPSTLVRDIPQEVLNRGREMVGLGRAPTLSNLSLQVNPTVPFRQGTLTTLT